MSSQEGIRTCLPDKFQHTWDFTSGGDLPENQLYEFSPV
jgi:hypothetical protein